MTAPGVHLPQRGVAPALTGATGWLNSPRLGADQLRGRVVLYVFWTYTCINWLRSLPYIRAWAEKYRERGLVVVGVHTPEFTFEKDRDNVARAVAAQDVTFPVVLDSDYEIWRAFDNHYWPALYLVDHGGVLRYEHFGEGRYPNTERAIQQLLREAGIPEVATDLVQPGFRPVEAPADWDDLETPETYLGFGRSDGRIAISEQWTAHDDRIVAAGSDGHISIPFHARDLNLVMKPVDADRPVRFRVTVDGRAPGNAHGLDVDASGSGVLAEARMYQLVRQKRPIVDRTAEVSFAEGGVEAFVVTFG